MEYCIPITDTSSVELVDAKDRKTKLRLYSKKSEGLSTMEGVF